MSPANSPPPDSPQQINNTTRQQLEHSLYAPHNQTGGLLGFPWLTRDRAIAGGFLLLVLLGMTGLLLRPQPQQHTAVVESPEANKEALLLSVQGETDATLRNARIQLQQYREDLLKAEARRMQVKAEEIIRDRNAACFRQPLDCAYEALLMEALGRLVDAQNRPDDASTRLALDEVAAIEYARAGVTPVAPEHALSRLALQQMIEAMQQQRVAAAETKASELLQEAPQ